MEIKDMSWEIVEIPLTEPFKIALGTTYTYRGIIVKICTDEFCGIGEAAPSPRITGDTVGSVIAALELFKPAIIGMDALEIGKSMTRINRIAARNSTAKAAVDFALYDLLGKRAGMPVRNLLGAEKDRIETSLTVTIGTLEESVKSAEKLLDAGARVLKVKIGLDPQQDIERIKALRDLTDVKIRVDANQGYSLKRAIKVLKALEKYDIEFAEQPIPAAQIDNLAILRRETAVPIMADEAMHTKEDVLRLAGKVDAINIKLMKSGGIHEALKLAHVAKAAGMKIMIGCMIETKLGISAGTHFALGIGADYADLDGYWDLTEQPFEGVKLEDGYNILPDAPGLGVRRIQD
uniref:L-alanine-DL-glutamate epimerase-like n=1 Tax=uncultured euryarchaeote Alv-FOS1 TaxID=337892 RepID=Q3SAA3_9EURY|nr:L-alanine-DL-glutamate epimerase-like [uncultured euryarchaeote Alv-FOS1]